MLFTSASAQTPVIDSLIGLLRTTTDYTDRISLNYRIQEQLNEYDATSPATYLEAGYALAKAKKDTYYIAYYYQHKGNWLFDRTRYNESVKYFDSAIVLYDVLITAEKNAKKLETYQYGKIDCLIGKGLLLSKIYHYQESINYYLQSIAALEQRTGNKRNLYMATLYNDIASDYSELEQFEYALKYDKAALPFLNKNEDEDLFVVAHLFVADDYSGLM